MLERGHIGAMKIGRIQINPQSAPLVVPEIGINHEGSLDTARQMVDAAHRAGALLIKHQTHVPSDEMSSAAKSVIPGNADVSIYEIMERCALSEDDERRLQDHVMNKGLEYISTPFSRAAADRLQKMDVPAFKIGSGECNNYPLIEHIAAFGKPIILSTGMNTIDTVRPAVEVLRKAKVPFALLHTTNLYPTPEKLVRLGAMMELHEAFPDAIYGLSDHTTSNLACIAATALGAQILERHFTDRMDRPGPDIVNSMDESECAALIAASQSVWSMRGGKKEPAPEEKVTIDFAFATVVSLCDIQQGDVLNHRNIWVKRPGTGEIQAADFSKLIGKHAAKPIKADAHVRWEDVGD